MSFPTPFDRYEGERRTGRGLSSLGLADDDDIDFSMGGDGDEDGDVFDVPDFLR